MSLSDDTPDLGAKLKRLMDKILDELDEADTSLEQKIDALKAVGTLHLGMEKLAGKMPPDDGGPTFGDLRRRANGEQ